jgi:hypothetical protein
MRLMLCSALLCLSVLGGGCAAKHTATPMMSANEPCAGRRVLEVTNAGQQSFNVYWLPDNMTAMPAMTEPPVGATLLGRAPAGVRHQTTRFTIPGPGRPFVAGGSEGPTPTRFRFVCEG